MTWLANWLFDKAISVSSRSFGLSSTSRMGLSMFSFGTGSVIRCMFRESEREGRAFALPGLGPHPAIVPLDDAADVGQADAGSLEVFHTVQALEYAEQLVHVVHVETGAIVGYMEYGFAGR